MDDQVERGPAAISAADTIAAIEAKTNHTRLPHDATRGWAVGDWHCSCGWFGNLGWEGFASHLSAVLILLSAEITVEPDTERLLRIARAAQAWRDKPYATNSDPEWIEVVDALCDYGEDRLREAIG